MRFFSNIFKNIPKPLILLPLALAFISMLMMVSNAYDNGLHLSRDVIVQGAAFVIGFFCIMVVSNMDYTVFQDIEKYLYIGSLVFLLTVYIPGLGVEQMGARSWINLGFTYFQPSEIVKITYILLFANYLQKKKNTLRTFMGIVKSGLYCAPFILIIVIEDLGSALVFLSVWVIMVFYAGIDHKIFAKAVGVSLLMIPIVYKFMAYHQKVRIDAFLHPDNLSLEGNYQVFQSKIAIGSGGLFGKGLFQGTQKSLGFLPVRTSDFIFSVVVEELGLIGGAIVIGIYSWLIFAMTKVALACKDLYGSLIVMGIVGMFTFQIFENISMTMGIMPVTGITLPFLSYGGSAIISNLIALGFVINIAGKNRGVKF